MARLYDIAARLADKNKRSEVILDAEHSYKVNTSKEAVLFIIATTEDEKMKEFDKMDKIISLALGKEALDYINEQDYQMAARTLIIEAIIAAIQDMDLEEGAAKQGKKSK